MDCSFVQLETGHWKCVVCNHTTKRAYDTAPSKAHCKPGLGDCVENGLNTLGLTKTVWKRLLGAITGRRVRRCGCVKRKATLNKLGVTIVKLVKRI